VQRIINESLEQVSQKFVRVDDVLLIGVELPPTVKATVEDKMAQKEKAESYEYRLDIERREAERRLIEANGLKAANDILNSSLTPQILTWKGIEASTELAKSPNAKTLIMGSSKNGLPVLMPDATP
jgi:regulator of protease activity HflC (stomatin/prohibitin superfamily)